MSGTFAFRQPLPFTPGSAGVGTVTAGEPHLVGKRVLVRGAGIGLERPGTWAEHVTVPAGTVRVVPDAADAALAATCYSPMTTAWAAAGPVGQLQPGERVLVTGASGGVGSLTVQLAARAGAHVVAGVRSEKVAATVPAAAAEVFVGQDPGTVEHLRAGGGTDAVLDTVGGSSVPTLLPAVNPGGRVVMIGYLAGKTLTVDLPTLLAADVSLLPMNMVRRHVPDDVFETLLTELTDGALTLTPTTFAFGDINKALAALTVGTLSGAVAVTV